MTEKIKGRHDYWHMAKMFTNHEPKSKNYKIKLKIPLTTSSLLIIFARTEKERYISKIFLDIKYCRTVAMKAERRRSWIRNQKETIKIIFHDVFHKICERDKHV